MASSSRFLSVLALAAFPLWADEIAGPVMGYVSGPDGRSIRAIRGLPGSALLGEAIPLEPDVLRSEISPSQDAVLLWGEAFVRLGALRPDAPPESSPVSLPEGAVASVGAFSPGGKNLVLLDRQRSAVYSMPLSAGRAGETRTAALSIPDGAVKVLAVSDGDEPLVAGIVEGEVPAVFVADLAGNYRSMSDFARPAWLAFLGSTRDLAVADAASGAVFRMTNALSGAAPEPLYPEGLSGDRLRIVSSPDGRTLLILDSTRTVRSIDFRSGTVSSIDCECSPDSPQGLRGRSVFRLTQALDQPIWILDAGFGEPRLVFVPAASEAPRP